MKRILLIPALALSGLMALALGSCQSPEYDNFGDIRGQVIHPDNSLGIPEALISLSPGGKTCLTDSNGSFGFEALEIQQYTLTVQKEGYETNRKSLNPVPGQSVECLILLSPRNK